MKIVSAVAPPVFSNGVGVGGNTIRGAFMDRMVLLTTKKVLTSHWNELTSKKDIYNWRQ